MSIVGLCNTLADRLENLTNAYFNHDAQGQGDISGPEMVYGVRTVVESLRAIQEPPQLEPWRVEIAGRVLAAMMVMGPEGQQWCQSDTLVPLARKAADQLLAELARTQAGLKADVPIIGSM